MDVYSQKVCLNGSMPMTGIGYLIVQDFPWIGLSMVGIIYGF
jgi:hypothetical protein